MVRCVLATVARKIILVVDDEPTVLHYVVRALEARGYAAIEAASAEDGLKACERLGDTLAMVISDVSMPGMNGREFAKCIKKLHHSLPVILMSGYSSTSPVLEGLQDGRVDNLRFLKKPFLPKDLERAVLAAFGESSMSHQ